MKEEILKVLLKELTGNVTRLEKCAEKLEKLFLEYRMIPRPKSENEKLFEAQTIKVLESTKKEGIHICKVKEISSFHSINDMVRSKEGNMYLLTDINTEENKMAFVPERNDTDEDLTGDMFNIGHNVLNGNN